MKNIYAISLALTTALATYNLGFAQNSQMDQETPTMGWFPKLGWTTWSIDGTNAWSLFDPYLLDIPSGGKGLAVYDANDSTKIIGYVNFPEKPKPTGPVHCAVNEKLLLAKSVDDCEAVGGAVTQ